MKEFADEKEFWLRGFTDFELPELILDVYNPIYGAVFAKPVLDSRTEQDQDQIKWNPGSPRSAFVATV